MTIEVGLGTGDKQAKIAMLQTLITAQVAAMPYGLASPQTMYNALSKLTEEAGYRDPEQFWVNPTKPHPPIQVPPKPELLVEQAKIAADAEKSRQESNYRRMGIEADLVKSKLDSETAQNKAFLDAQVNLAKFALEQDSAHTAAGGMIDPAHSGEAKNVLGEAIMRLAAPKKPARRVVKHIRDENGRIAASEVIDMPDEEQ
jgi:hypothetical protein